MNYISSPNLPKEEVSVFIADAKIENRTVISPPEIPLISPALRRHTDLGIVMVSGKKAVCPPETCTYYKRALSPYNIEIIKGETNVVGNYPGDCAYNVCIVGKKCFLNKKVCDRTLYDILISEGYEIIHVNQGYTKCSVCPIDENSFITADRKIALEGIERAMDVLLISNNGILLPGYKNGFWGGCCGLGGKDILFVNGEIETIQSGKEIKNFLDKKGIKIKPLKKGEIVDIGSLLPLITY